MCRYFYFQPRTDNFTPFGNQEIIKGVQNLQSIYFIVLPRKPKENNSSPHNETTPHVNGTPPADFEAISKDISSHLCLFCLSKCKKIGTVPRMELFQALHKHKFWKKVKLKEGFGNVIIEALNSSSGNKKN